jgi:SAM-dependent methyltransferase
MSPREVVAPAPVESDRAAERHYWEAIAGEWQRERPHGLWRAHSDAVNGGLVARWLPGGLGRVLKTDSFDEACSDGLYRLLAARARQVVGIDLSVGVQRAATARHPGLRGVAADMRRLPFADASFDAVISSSTLDHFATVAEIALSLRELWRVMRPGGVLVLTLDNPVNPLLALRGALPFALWRRLGLVPYYTGATLGPRALARALDEAGFAAIELGAVMHCPRVAGVALARLLERRAGPATQAHFLRLLHGWERLERWPTRYLTGHFVAVRAARR